MPPSGQKSKSQVEFFPGQRDRVGQVFDVGGLFDQILGGRPNAGFMAGQNRAGELLTRRQAQSGLLGSGLAARQDLDFATQSARASEQDFLNNILAFMQPAGSQGSTKSTGLLGGMFGIG